MMSKTEQAIKILKKDPFKKLADVAAEVGLANANSLRNLLRQNKVSVAEMREEAIRQMKNALPDDFEYDWNNLKEENNEN